MVNQHSIYFLFITFGIDTWINLLLTLKPSIYMVALAWVRAIGYNGVVFVEYLWCNLPEISFFLETI